MKHKRTNIYQNAALSQDYYKYFQIHIKQGINVVIIYLYDGNCKIDLQINILLFGKIVKNRKQLIKI